MEVIVNSPSASVAFYIFNYPIKIYGIILAFSLFVGMSCSLFLFFKKNPTNEFDLFQDSFFYSVIFSILGARLFYVLGNFSYYINNFKEIICINHGGISIYGAIIFGMLSLFCYCKIKKQSFLKYADYYALFMPLCQAIGRFGNYFNQEAFGKPSFSFFKLYVEKNYRPKLFENYDYFHPAFLYESIFNLILFFILTVIFFKFKNIKQGTILYIYLVSYSLIRFFMEMIRIDTLSFNPYFSIVQIIALFIICFGLYQIFMLYKK